MHSITILGVRIDNVSLDEAVAQIERFLAAGTPHQVVTVNPEFVMEAQHNAAFAAVLRDAALAVPDGIGLNLVARLLRLPLRGRVPGVELCERLAALSANKGYRLFLLGAAPRVAEATAQVLQQHFTGVVIAGCYAGSPRPEDESAIHQRILAAKPDILMVAYGAPAQELWIARNQPLLHIPIAIGVGGTFDELAGVVQRTPKWVQRIGMKWLHRLIQQPWRWKRIWTAVVKFPLAVWRDQRRQNIRNKKREVRN
jgi:N-acetylglucosaminyldiphosphoundecaprenol N-acetyl-beta-D-mannosaminyltransferase